MKNYLIFAGTTEGRQLTEFFLKQNVTLTVCIATEYGKILLPSHPNLTIISKRMNAAEMYDYMTAHSFDGVFDATHPYAVIVSENIKAATEKAGLTYFRILRPKENFEDSEHIVYVSSMEEAVSYLSHTEGNILATTGSKELSKFCSLPNYQERVYARILSNPEMVAESFQLGFQGKHLICMQGPFSEELNTALIHQFHISYMVTKNSGKIGGFIEKVNSAKQTNTTLIIIGRPKEETEGYLLEDIYSLNLTAP